MFNASLFITTIMSFVAAQNSPLLLLCKQGCKQEKEEQDLDCAPCEQFEFAVYFDFSLFRGDIIFLTNINVKDESLLENTLAFFKIFFQIWDTIFDIFL